jgi:hypothetical protein
MAAQRATVGKAINIDKSRLLREKPTSYTAPSNQSVLQLIETVKRKFPELNAGTIEGEAEEVE